MKTPFSRMSLVALGLTVIVPAWGSLTQNVYAVRLPPGRVVASSDVTPPKQLEPVPIPPGITLDSGSSGQWVELKDYTFARRDLLLSGLTGMMERVDAQIEELKTKRAALVESGRAIDWDIALKEMHQARATLKSACNELNKATPEMWDEQRDRVGQAWARAQNAYGVVRSTARM
ncbi:MAG TPA: hypothetical protein VIM71_12075 [Lacunisphaera sp.]